MVVSGSFAALVSSQDGATFLGTALRENLRVETDHRDAPEKLRFQRFRPRPKAVVSQSGFWDQTRRPDN